MAGLEGTSRGGNIRNVTIIAKIHKVYPNGASRYQTIRRTSHCCKRIREFPQPRRTMVCCVTPRFRKECLCIREFT